MSNPIADKDSVFAILIGTNGTGKSTVLRQIMEKSRVNGNRVLVIPSNLSEPSFKDIPQIHVKDLNTFSGAKKIMCYNTAEFAYIAKRLRNCTLISDDFRNYIEQSQMHPDVRRLFVDRRHNNIDIYMAAHGPAQIPPAFYDWLDFIFLFRTVGNFKRAQDKLLSFDVLLEKQKQINHIAQTSNPYHYEIIRNG